MRELGIILTDAMNVAERVEPDKLKKELIETIDHFNEALVPRIIWVGWDAPNGTVGSDFASEVERVLLPVYGEVMGSDNLDEKVYDVIGLLIEFIATVKALDAIC